MLRINSSKSLPGPRNLIDKTTMKEDRQSINYGQAKKHSHDVSFIMGPTRKLLRRKGAELPINFIWWIVMFFILLFISMNILQFLYSTPHSIWVMITVVIVVRPFVWFMLKMKSEHQNMEICFLYSSVELLFDEVLPQTAQHNDIAKGIMTWNHHKIIFIR